MADYRFAIVVSRFNEEITEGLLRGARERLGADLAVAVTGVAGPGGGTPEKPVGLVYLHADGGWASEGRRMQWPGSRSAVRSRAMVASLHLLRELLVAKS